MGVGFFNYNKGKKIAEGLKKAFSKTDDTITGMKPSGKRDKTREYKENLMFKRLGNEQKKMEDFATEKRNKASKKLFKDK